MTSPQATGRTPNPSPTEGNDVQETKRNGHSFKHILDAYCAPIVCLCTCTQNKIMVAMPHQLCREYMSGIFAALWKSNTAAKPANTRISLGVSANTECLSLSLFCFLTNDADDEGQQVNDAVKDLDIPL